MNSDDVEWIVRNWEKIPDKFKTDIRPGKAEVPELRTEGHIVVLLLDRQKPSVKSNYEFDEERIGVNRFGEVVWGFDSGCSCPTPWYDSYPDCYDVKKTWKEFTVDCCEVGFDSDFLAACDATLAEIKKEVNL